MRPLRGLASTTRSRENQCVSRRSTAGVLIVLITFALGVAVGAAAATVPFWVIVLVVGLTDAAIAAGAGIGFTASLLLLAPWLGAPFLIWLREVLTQTRPQSPIPMEQRLIRQLERGPRRAPARRRSGHRSAQPPQQVPFWLEIVSLTSGIATGIGGTVVAIIALWD
jgi:hypothetical protein